MPHNITCVELHADEWARLSNIRLKALIDSPYAFGGTYENERLFDEDSWRLEFAKQAFVIASVDGIDAGMMYVENLVGDFGATCWIGGCWSDPDFRGVGLMRAMFEFLDKQAASRDWLIQGLGVWTDNDLAISAYEKLGFVEMGGPQPSTRQPGKFYQRMIRKTINA
jgi:GNAT superfamily N-acetyltransferase